MGASAKDGAKFESETKSREFTERSHDRSYSIHGLDDLVTARTHGQTMMWTLVLGGALFGFSYNTYMVTNPRDLY